MKKKRTRNELRKKRKLRCKVVGTPNRPRLVVYKSLRHIYAQLVDDTPPEGSRTIVSVSTLSPELKGKVKDNVEAAKQVGVLIAKLAKAQGITQVVFDRGGYPYHGKVKALAEAAREGGLAF